MSTAFVARPPDAGESPDQGPGGPAAYIASKIAAERAVRDSGLPATIVRPSIIIGDTADGHISAFQGLHKVAGSIVLNAVPVVPAAPDSLIDCVPQDVAARAVGMLVRAGQTGEEHWLTAGESALPLIEMVDGCVAVAHRFGLRPDRPRMVPAESVDRLLMPLLAEVASHAQRRRFKVFTELMLLFQGETALPSTLDKIGPGLARDRAGLREAFIRSVEYWAHRQGVLVAATAARNGAVA
ncbi:hypothetical protein Misp01_52540 [Microtetraspora sp. NBRC 13810]|nr:hypothetical protein Misp01_52540 [Microtetraspora sp. NBRC 13810]